MGNFVTRGHIGNVLYFYSLFIVNFPSLCALCYLIFILSFADGKSDREREQGMNKTLSGIYFYLLLLPVWKLLLILLTIILMSQNTYNNQKIYKNLSLISIIQLFLCSIAFYFFHTVSQNSNKFLLFSFAIIIF